MEFEQHILVHIHYDGIILLEDHEKYFQLKLNVSEFANYVNETCEVFKYKIESSIKSDLVTKLKSKIENVIEISRKYKIPVKHLLHTRFMNHQSNQIEIVWSSSALKEFQYVPTRHYFQHRDDSLTLRVKGFRFRYT